ncbi:MAG: DegT/DnrJ/EryC1/StrS aminotransferase family protein, partial [Gemmatimonadetes bacterium]|nr:DegT/DnrJ/EryC1/StrS aminotransferase family protein [Gemmatimonadota bacterium]
MWAPKRIDITTADLAAGLVGCFTPADHAREALIFEAELSSAKDLLVCTSVRSGFDALLTALRLPAGTEILFTAMTVADMPRIAKYHDLVPVPVDVDIDSMAPRVEALEEVVTSACRVLVLTHLFGGRIDFSTSISWARRRGMVVIEDCAEAYWDPAYLGDPRADVSLFSFGPIKHRTALGGAVVRITRADLLARVRRVIAEHPAQKSSQYAARLLKYGVLHKISARVSY